MSLTQGLCCRTDMHFGSGLEAVRSFENPNLSVGEVQQVLPFELPFELSHSAIRAFPFGTRTQ
jgi:hypothetical protein